MSFKVLIEVDWSQLGDFKLAIKCLYYVVKAKWFPIYR